MFFSVDSYVWIPDEISGVSVAQVLSQSGDSVFVRSEVDAREFNVSAGDCRPCSESTLMGLDDMVHLDELHEGSLLHTLSIRFSKDLPYTYTGPYLVSVNPFKRIPAVYGEEVMKSYVGLRQGIQSPHLYAIAEECVRLLQQEGINQSCVISGESGAGKTEATKILLRYIAFKTSASHSQNSSSGKSINIEEQIMESNPILEAFGNAKTVRNNNSSRFGKFLKIHFSLNKKLIGGSMDTYLLEKTRVINQAPEERNYHIFYQMLAGASDKMRQELSLGEPSEFAFLRSSGCYEVLGMDDAEEYGITRTAMTKMGISSKEQVQLFKVLAAILHLGNAEFVADDNDGADIQDANSVILAATMLKVEANALQRCLCNRSIKVGADVMEKPLTRQQAINNRDAFSKALYSGLFDWLVSRINIAMTPSESSVNFIGILDIFGFESFDFNSFEQLCINLANEKLQQHFNQHAFKTEQKIYEEEGVEWKSVNFTDNQQCLDLIEKKFTGILSILEEECRLPRGSDDGFLDKVIDNHSRHPNFDPVRKSRTNFQVSHFAGEVEYNSSNFLDKNKDAVSDDLKTLARESRSTFVQELFPKPSEAASSSSGRRGGKSKSSTVGSKFKGQLTQLMKSLAETEPHFVRCLKPNSLKLPSIFDHEMMLRQLRYTGMMDSILIRKMGFPIRVAHQQFAEKYRILADGSETVSISALKEMDWADQCVALLQFTDESADSEFDDESNDNQEVTGWAIGTSKVFLKDDKHSELELYRERAMGRAVVVIQRFYRGYKVKTGVRRFLERVRWAAVLIQTNYRGFRMRKIVQEMIRQREQAAREANMKAMQMEERYTWALMQEEFNRAAKERMGMMREEQYAESLAWARLQDQRRHRDHMIAEEQYLVQVQIANDLARSQREQEAMWREERYCGWVMEEKLRIKAMEEAGEEERQRMEQERREQEEKRRLEREAMEGEKAKQAELERQRKEEEERQRKARRQHEEKERQELERLEREERERQLRSLDEIEEEVKTGGGPSLEESRAQMSSGAGGGGGIGSSRFGQGAAVNRKTMRQQRLAKGEGLYRFSSVKLGEGSQAVQLALSRREQFGELARGDSNSSIVAEKVDAGALAVMKKNAQKRAVKMLSGSLLPVLESGSFLQRKKGKTGVLGGGGSGAALMNFVCLSHARTHLLVVGNNQGNVNVGGADVVQAYVEYRSQTNGRPGLSDSTRSRLIELGERIDVRDIKGIHIPKRYLGMSEWNARFINKETLSFSILFKSTEQAPLEFIAMDLGDYVDWVEGLRVLLQHKMVTPKMLSDIEMLTEVEISNEMRSKGYAAKVNVKSSKKGTRKRIMVEFDRMDGTAPQIPAVPESLEMEMEKEQEEMEGQETDEDQDDQGKGKGKEGAGSESMDSEELKKRIKRNAAAVVMEQKVIEMFVGAFFERDRDEILDDEEEEENGVEASSSSSSSSSSIVSKKRDGEHLSVDVSLTEADQLMLGVGMVAAEEDEGDEGATGSMVTGLTWDEDEDDFDDEDAKVLMFVKLSQNRRNIMYRDSTDGVNLLQLYSNTKSDEETETNDRDLRMIPLSSVVSVESEDIKMRYVLRFKDGSEWKLQAVRKGDFTLWSDGLRYLIGQDVGASIIQSEILMIANNWFQDNGYALLDGTVVVKVVLPHNNGSSSTIKIQQDETVEKLLQTICAKREIDPLDYYLHFADRPTALDLGMGVLELNGKLLILSSMASTLEDFADGMASDRAMDNIASQKHMMRELSEMSAGPSLGGQGSSSGSGGGNTPGSPMSMGADFVKINFSLENFSVMRIDETTTIRQLLEQACQKRGLIMHNYQLLLVDQPEHALMDEVTAASFSGREYLLVSRRQQKEERKEAGKQYSMARSRANSNVNQMPSRSFTEKLKSSGTALSNRARRGSGSDALSKRSSAGSTNSTNSTGSSNGGYFNSSSSSNRNSNDAGFVLSENPPGAADDPSPGLSALQNSVLVHISSAFQSMAVERGSVETYEDILQHVCGVTGRSFLEYDIRDMENEPMTLTDTVDKEMNHLVMVNCEDEDFLWPTEQDTAKFQEEFEGEFAERQRAEQREARKNRDVQSKQEQLEHLKQEKERLEKEEQAEERRKAQLNVFDIRAQALATDGRDWTIADACLKSGFMKKRGHLVRNWKKRWFILTITGKLFYFKNVGDEEPAGSIDLEIAVIDDEAGTETKNGWPFVISETTGKEKSYILCTETRIERQIWLDEIRKHI